MEVTYELTAADLSAFQWRATRRLPLARRTRRNTYLYLLLAFFLMSLVPAIGGRGRFLSIADFNLYFLLTGFPLTALLFWLIEKRMMRRAIDSIVAQEKPDKGRLGTHTLKLDDYGVTERTLVGESKSLWAGIEKIEEDAEYIYIYTAPGAAHVVPRRAFKTPDDANAFFEFANTRATVHRTV